MDRNNNLRELHRKYAQTSIPDNIADIVKDATGICLGAKYIDIQLKNPLLVAPGQLTLRLNQVESIKKAGFAGCVIKSVVGETPDGLCSMSVQRKRPSYIKSFYEPNDTRCQYPIIHWDGRCDARALADYLKFAGDVKTRSIGGRFAPIASILCHLPLPGETFKEDEWTNTTRAIYDAGYSHIEIDFCPFLSGDDYTKDQNNVLRWYRTCSKVMKSVSDKIRVIPKMLNLEWGLDFQLRLAEAALEGGANGLVVANRTFKPEYNSGHGGNELRQKNLLQVRKIKKLFPSLSLSATGGVYDGRMAFEYLQAGADNVQVLSYIMGKVQTPFIKCGNKFDQVFHKLLLDPETGLVAAMLDADAEASV